MTAVRERADISAVETFLQRGATIGAVITAFLAVFAPVALWCVKLEIKTNTYDNLVLQRNAERARIEARIDAIEDRTARQDVQLARVETKVDLILTAMRIKFDTDRTTPHPAATTQLTSMERTVP